ncbi:MAG: cysteine peptidase family C39 domain-containing protein [Ignavibacteriae bacterium]|nr:cysteine peptidase family C39 domain-containing protein [Ignavibacteriota bacterium]
MTHNIYLPDTLQFYDYDCGTTCAQAVLAYYGEDISEIKLLKKIKPSKKYGTKSAQIEKYFKNRGFTVHAGSMSIPELKKFINRKIPVILFLQAWGPEGTNYKNTQAYGHYAIVCGYNTKGIILEDPAIFGKGFLSYKELEKRWHGEDNGFLSQYGIAVWGKGRFNYKKLIKIT